MSTAVKTIHLSEIRTDPRVNRPVDQAWVDKLVTKWHEDAIGVPIVAAHNGHYVILDGQHRIEAVRQMNSKDARVQVKVMDGLQIADMARLFVELNEDRGIPAFVKFEKRITSGDPVAVAIEKVVKRAGLILRNEPHDRCVGAVVALEAVFNYDETGEVLERTLISLLTGLGEGAESFNNNLIRGMGQFHRRYPAADKARLVNHLKKHAAGGYGLLGKAKAQRDINGGSMGANVTEVLIRIYNRGMKQNKLEH